jgi:hypothetical protein
MHHTSRQLIAIASVSALIVLPVLVVALRESLTTTYREQLAPLRRSLWFQGV